MDAAKTVLAVGLIVLERQCLLDIDDRVDTESSQALVKPPVDILIDFFPYLRVLPVQVRLFLVKCV